MKRRVLLSLVVCTSLLALLTTGVTRASAEYLDGTLVGVVTDGGGRASFGLPAGAFFPQASWADVPLAGATTVEVSNGAALDFHLKLQKGSDRDVVAGQMRYTLLQAGDAVMGHLVALVGTYTLSLRNEFDLPYTISGPVLGDQQSLYFTGRDTYGTADAADDSVFLMRVDAVGMGGTDTQPGYIAGNAQVLSGGGVSRPMTSVIGATRVEGSATSVALDGAGFTAGSSFNRVAPADGSGDILLDADTAGSFVSLQRLGTIGGTGTLNSAATTLLLGTGASAVGTVVSRFTHVQPDGKPLHGFWVVDLGTSDGTSRQVDGFIFSLVTPDSAPTLLFGTVTGTVSADSVTMSLTPDAAYWTVDSTPPEPWNAGGPDLLTTGYQGVWTAARDLNGWSDLSTVSLLINDSRASNRILARYQAGPNLLSLYDPILKKWGTGCRPGAAGTVRNQWVTLNCRQTRVYRFGEQLAVSWSLKPSTKMLGSWRIYLKAADRAGLVGGWRHLGGLEVKASP